MKRIPTLSLFILAALSAIPAARAQGVVLKADVPFGFSVGDTAMPAGEYMISSPSSDVIRIASVGKNISATVSSLHGFNDAGQGSKLVFQKYGDHYFLHRVLCSRATSLNVDIPTWNAEKIARRNREAKLDRGETILVAAR